MGFWNNTKLNLFHERQKGKKKLKKEVLKLYVYDHNQT